jgi:hypothetical protein
MTNVMYVVCDGPPDYAHLTLPNLEAYARRIDCQFVVVGGGRMQPEYPNNHFLLYECYKDFVKSDYERMLFCDLDIIINKNAPSVFEQFSDGMWMRT